MSEPCPPAFMRTAPPTEPGTPTAHSNPRQPRRRQPPGHHGERRPAADLGDRRDPRRRPTVMSPSSRATTRRCRRSRHRPPTGWSPRPTTSTGRPDAWRARGDALQVVERRGPYEQRRRPAQAVGGQRTERHVALGQRRRARPPPARPRPATSSTVRRPVTGRAAAARRASTSSGSVAMSPQPIEMQTSPGPTSPARNEIMSSRRRQPHDVGVGMGVRGRRRRRVGR